MNFGRRKSFPLPFDFGGDEFELELELELVEVGLVGFEGDGAAGGDAMIWSEELLLSGATSRRGLE